MKIQHSLVQHWWSITRSHTFHVLALFTAHNFHSPRKANKMLMLIERLARCSRYFKKSDLPFRLTDVRLIYVRIDIYCHVKTNYLAARNKHITNYQFFSRKVHIVTHVAHCWQVACVVKIVKMWMNIIDVCICSNTQRRYTAFNRNSR